jgi:phosphomannomutase
VASCYDEAQAVADACGADIILATDPDGDRIGLEVRGADGGWIFVSGNEILFLITRFVLDRRRALDKLPSDAFVLTTTVTSSLVGTIARSYGCAVVDRLLVGFKYMADVMAHLEEGGRWQELSARPESLMIGCEESHGVLLTPAIRDKDAAGAALALAELNAVCRYEGRTVLDELDAIYARFGYVSNRLVNTVMTGSTGLARIRAIQQSLRSDPPTEVAGRAVVSFEDLADQSGWMGPIKSGTDAAGRNVLLFGLADGSRVIIRPSGTEPKNKIYVEVPGTTPAGDLSPDELAAERKRCDAESAALGRAFERLMLERVGIVLPDWALAVSGLVGLEHKRHFADELLPELERRARAGESLDAWLDKQLAPYGKDPRDLVASGVTAWLAAHELPAAAARTVRTAFRFGG